MPDSELPNCQIQLQGHSVTVQMVTPALGQQAMGVDAGSPRATHVKFLGGLQRLPSPLLKKLSGTELKLEVARVATVDGTSADATAAGGEHVVGVLRHSPQPSDNVHALTMTIADKWPSRGLTVPLAKQLIEFAKSQGIIELYCLGAANDRAIGDLAKALGMFTRRDPTDPQRVVYALTIE